MLPVGRGPVTCRGLVVAPVACAPVPSHPATAALADRRARLLARATGRVLEVGADLEGANHSEGSYDSIVSVLALCRAPDLKRALSTIRHLLAPGGTFLFVEHVRATGLRARLQRLATPVWRRVVPGCHLDRDLPAALRAAGFVVTDCVRFALPGANPLLRPAVQGAARVRLAPLPTRPELVLAVSAPEGSDR